tara:strand:+ start:2249 stop:3247 length:999 start_codon:yes stop_codon:yes gene_type:complete
VTKDQTKAIVAIKKETEDIVLGKIQRWMGDGQLNLPEEYSPSNAIHSAFLALQQAKDRNDKPVLQTCTRASVANALLDMVVQGLSPSRQQCYFIPYGNVLTMTRSYFGTKAVALRLNPEIKDIYAEVVYEGDDLQVSIHNGRRNIQKHVQEFANIDDSKITGAYAVAVDQEGNTIRCELMTMDQIKNSWKQSKMKPINDDGSIKLAGVHGKFPGEMAKRTVTARLAKHFVNSAPDSDLVIEHAQHADDQAAAAAAEEEIETQANQELIDINGATGEVIDIKEKVEEDDPGDPATCEHCDLILDTDGPLCKECQIQQEVDDKEHAMTGHGPGF